ncbi:MAG: hypothetical protein ACTSVZ_00310 [Promethearchaeota archaeon]
MKKVIPLLGYFLGLILTLIILGNFYPPLNLDLQLDDIEKFVLRFLATFSYYGDITQFWILVGVSTGLFETVIIFSYFKTKFNLNPIAISILGTLALSNYFFWVLSNQISPTSGNIRFTLPTDFFRRIAIYFSILVSLGLLNILILPKVFRVDNSDQNISQSPPNKYQCPDCNTLYYSNVSYCTHCQKSIVSTKFIDKIDAVDVVQEKE